MKHTQLNRFPLRATALTAVVLPLLLTACGGGSGSSAAPAPTGPQNIAIEFAAKAGNVPVQCGSKIAGLGTGNIGAELRDLRFYVSNVALINDKGEAVPLTLQANDWQSKEVALVDLEDATGTCAEAGTAGMNKQIVGNVPAGTYKGVQMTIGVPSSVNHSDFAVAAKPLDIQAMAWSWQAGRKFAKIEINPDGGVARPAPAAAGKSFFVHIGSTGCTGNPVTGETVSCARPDRMDFKFDSFDATKQKVVLDIAQLFKGSDVSKDEGGAVGCMSGATDPECPAIFNALKIDLASGQSVSQGAGQAVFRAEAK
ncbi:MAG: metallo-mystery pair system four-Cys motif protein [Giesbergeria sp.]|jgi:uncharacterized repeat protein (TIGR04052 family)|nr:metallo-mystery pair system four-Cys motif protein [Giesbergeria sp.]